MHLKFALSFITKLLVDQSRGIRFRSELLNQIKIKATKETSQRGETFATLRPILIGPRIETQTSRSDGGV